MSRRRRHMLATLFVAAGLGACGSSAPLIRSTGFHLDDMGHISGCTGYGHSGMASINIPPPKAFLTNVCGYLGQSALNLGVPGSSAQNQNLAMVAATPEDAATQVSLVWWGLNDLGAFGPRLDGFKASMRFLISRLRSAKRDVHNFANPAFTYSGGPWDTQPGQRVTKTDGVATWTSPRGFPGGEVAFTFLFTRGVSADYAFALDGRPAGGFNSGALTPPPPAVSAVTGGAYRLRIPRGAGHQVRITLTNVVGGASISGWELESAKPPLVVLLEQFRLSSYRAYKDLSRFEPTDPQVEALNAATRDLAGEYGSYVTLVNLDKTMGKRPKLLFPDGLHPNLTGQKVITKAVEAAIAASPHVRGLPRR